MTQLMNRPEEDVRFAPTKAPAYRPVPGKPTVDALNRIVKVKSYGSDSTGEYVEVQLPGAYRASVRLPVSCIRPLTESERKELSDMDDTGFWP